MSAPMPSGDFVKVAGYRTGRQRKKPLPPFSIRFTEQERDHLKRQAGALSLAAYIRLKLFSEEGGPPARKTLSRKKHNPTMELAVLSQILGKLGKSEIAANMQVIADAAKVGALPVTPELEQEIKQACIAIAELRHELTTSLGIKTHGQ